jgi:hypothetical protein
MSSDKFCTALVKAQCRVGDIIGPLHAIYYHAELLGVDLQRETLADVRSKVEELLVAIIAAEQSIAPTAKSEPSNVVQIGSEYQRNLDTVAEIVGAPQFDGAA